MKGLSTTRKTLHNAHQGSLLSPTYVRDELQKIQVVYRGRNRYVKCFCGTTVPTTIIQHMRVDHPDVWKHWVNEFIRLRNLEYSYKRIMNCFKTKDGRLLFTWAVIEREIMKAAEVGDKVKIWQKRDIDAWEPTDFKLERTTVWEFEHRGQWAVHRGDYRGNWPPQIPRNLILKFTKPHGIVLDPFVGGGTTLIEAWLNNRIGIGIDVSPHAIRTTRAKIAELSKKDADRLTPILKTEFRPMVIQGDARKSVELVTHALRQRGFQDETVDLICAHPPYMNTLRYSEYIDDDLSRINDTDEFLREMNKVATQLWQLLRKDGICAVLIGDIRREGDVIPLGLKVAEQFTKADFTTKDIIVKLQHRDMSTEFYYHTKHVDYRIAHEYLFIFRK